MRGQLKSKKAVQHQQNFPLIPEDLMDAMEGAFPLRNPLPGTTYEDMLRAAGQRDVIDFLRHRFDQQSAAARSGESTLPLGLLR